MSSTPSEEEPMTGKTDFTDEEWARLKRAPFVAGMAISLADPGGPIEAVKETAATLKTVRAAEGGDRGARGRAGDRGRCGRRAAQEPDRRLQAQRRRQRRRRDPR